MKKIKNNYEKYMDRMILCCEKAEQFTKGVNPEQLKGDLTLYYGTLGCIQLAGWIAYHLPHDILQMFPEKGLERMITAGYALEKGPFDWKVDGTIILSLAQETMPNLIPTLKHIRNILLPLDIAQSQDQTSELPIAMWGS